MLANPTVMFQVHLRLILMYAPLQSFQFYFANITLISAYSAFFRREYSKCEHRPKILLPEEGFIIKKKHNYLGKVLANGYTYTTSYFTENPRRRYVRCSLYTKLGCKARAVQDCRTLELRVFGTHNHIPVVNEDSILTFFNELKKSIDLKRTLKDIYDEVAPRYPEGALRKPFESIRPSMSRWRAKLRSRNSF